MFLCIFSAENFTTGIFPEVLKYLSQRLDPERPRSSAELTAYIDLKHYFKYKFVQELFFCYIGVDNI